MSERKLPDVEAAIRGTYAVIDVLQRHGWTQAQYDAGEVSQTQVRKLMDELKASADHKAAVDKALETRDSGHIRTTVEWVIEQQLPWNKEVA